MPIRIRCCDKPRDRAQPMEDQGFEVSLASDPAASYTDTEPEFRVLCGSV